MPPKKRSDYIITEAHDHSIITDSREIFFHGYFDDSEDEDVSWKSANVFIKNMRILEQQNSSPIVVHQYSSGGEWTSGMAIYDKILFSKCPIIFLCYGIAASMGSIIPQAIHNKGIRVSMPNCDWLLHEGYTSADGTHKRFYSTAQYSERLRLKMYDIYSEVCMGGPRFQGYSKGKVKSFLKKKIESKEDWWLSASEAVDYGFCDGVFGTEGFEDIETIKGTV